MPQKRARYHHGDLANALLRATGTLIARHGVGGFSLREAAREVGVDPAACYRHFDSRKALLDAFAASGFARLAERLHAALAEKRAPDRQLAAMGRAYVQFALENPTHFQAMFFGRGVDVRQRIEGQPSGFAALMEAVDRWQLDVRGISREHQALALWAGVHGLASLLVERALHLTQGEAERLLDQTLKVSLTGMSALAVGFSKRESG